MLLLLLDSDDSVLLSFRQALFRVGIFTDGCHFRQYEMQIARTCPDAVMVLRPFEGGKTPRFASSFKARFKDIPLIYLCESKEDTFPYYDTPELAIKPPFSPATLVQEVMRFLFRTEKRNPAKRRVAEISDHLLEKDARLFGEPFHLTTTERVILRYLLFAFPRGTDVPTLMHYCLRPTSNCIPGNIPTHISMINKKAHSLTDKKLIVCENGLYRIGRSPKNTSEKDKEG